MKNTNDKPTIYFDLDGTLYDLYGQPNWLERLHASDPSAYAADAPLVDPEALADILHNLAAAGYTIGIITWLARGASHDYKVATRRIKKAWIQKYLPNVSEIHMVAYGTPKHRVAKNRPAIIVDDSPEVLTAWTLGDTIDARNDILPALRNLAKA